MIKVVAKIRNKSKKGLNMNRFSLIAFIMSMITLSAYSQDLVKKDYEVKTVVLDAGHGGKDPGAHYGNYFEKDITLKVAKLVGNKIKKEFPDVQVIYTREKDVFVELRERTNIANKNHADLFISIHCNATGGTKVKGTETFVMGLHKSKENLEVAKRENASILLEEDYEVNYSGYDPNSDESNIIFTLMQNIYLEQSLLLASFMEDKYVDRGYSTRGVKQSGFLVLYTAAMPSVLTEIGFITNSEDRKKMISSEGQEIIAQSIFEAFRKYKRSVEGLPDDSDSYANSYDANAQNNSSAEEATDTYYSVQFMTTSSLVDTKEKQYSKLKDISYKKHGNMYKYTTGKFSTRSEADAYLKTVKKLGFKDAFIVCLE